MGVTNIFKEAGQMGIYVNPDNIDFQRCLQQDIYVDKSMIIECINKYIDTEDRFINISMPLRFGKSMTANMFTAYYSRGCDSRKMFSELKIAKSADSALRKNLCKFSNCDKKRYCERLEKQPLIFLQYTITTVICQVSSAICGSSLSVMSDTIPSLTSKP